MTLYIYRWGNNPTRKELKGKVCELLARGRMNSCLVRFVDSGVMHVVSRNAIRKVQA